MGTDHIDLLYLHRVDPSVPIEETIGAMGQLVEQGSVRELGVCELSSELLERAASTHPLAALQSEWSLFTRDIESGPLDTARRHGLTVVAYSPLGRGMLTGEPASTTRLSVWDVRRFLPRWRGSNLTRNLEAVDTIRAIAADHGCTPAQVALAWLMDKGRDVVAIPGTANPRHLRDNIASLDIDLDRQDIARLDRLTAHGARGEGFGHHKPQ